MRNNNRGPIRGMRGMRGMRGIRGMRGSGPAIRRKSDASQLDKEMDSYWSKCNNKEIEEHYNFNSWKILLKKNFLLFFCLFLE